MEFDHATEEVSFFFIHSDDPLCKASQYIAYVLKKALELHDINDVPMIKRLRSGDLIVRFANSYQAKQLAKVHQLHDMPISISAPVGPYSRQRIILSEEATGLEADEIVEMLSHTGIPHAVKRNPNLGNTTPQSYSPLQDKINYSSTLPAWMGTCYVQADCPSTTSLSHMSAKRLWPEDM